MKATVKPARMSYLKFEDARVLMQATSISEVLSVAQEVIGRMPTPIRWIGGPLTSGTNPHEVNRANIHRAILWSKEQGISTFNYLIFQKHVLHIARRDFWKRLPLRERVKRRIKHRGRRFLSTEEEYGCQRRLLEEFYTPLFKQAMIGELWLLSGWYASLNAWHLRRFCLEHGIRVYEVPAERALVPKGLMPL